MSNTDTIGVRASALKLAASIVASTNEGKRSVQSPGYKAELILSH